MGLGEEVEVGFEPPPTGALSAKEPMLHLPGKIREGRWKERKKAGLKIRVDGWVTIHKGEP
jgi:hypothetical protein